MRLGVDAHSLSPIRRQLTEPLTPVFAGGGVPRDPARPGIREFTGFADADPSTVGQIIEVLKRSGYRPLRSPGAGPASSMAGCPPPRGASGETMKGKP
jgi:hypothetical protein